MTEPETAVAVYGIGYVGSVTAAILSDFGYSVTAVDIDASKVEQVNNGKSPVDEEQTDILINGGVESGRLCATTDGIEAARKADVSFVCTGTPVDHDGKVDISSVLGVADQVGRALVETNDYHTLVIRSTVPPGTIETVTDRIADVSNCEPGEDFGVVVNPEFLREGSAVEDFHDPPLIVVGTNHERAIEELRTIYDTLDLTEEFNVVEPGVAEIIKYVNNTFHALKVTFANEVGRICNHFDIDSRTVMDLFCQDRKLNLSPYYLRPGFSFGGGCLPKDTRAFATFGTRVDADLVDTILPANRTHLKTAAKRIHEYDPDTVGLVGLSFKAGTADMRHSPAVFLARELLDNGQNVIAFDEDVIAADIIGSNRSFVEQTLPELNEILTSSYEQLREDADLVVICTEGAEFEEVSNRDFAVYDLVGQFEGQEDTFTWYESLC